MIIIEDQTVALGCDNVTTHYGISFEYRKCDIQTNLMAIQQNLQQWSGDRTRKYYAVSNIVPKNFAIKQLLFAKTFKEYNLILFIYIISVA